MRLEIFSFFSFDIAHTIFEMLPTPDAKPLLCGVVSAGAEGGRTVGLSGGDNPVSDGFEQGGLCAVWWKGLLMARPMAHNI